MIFLFQAGTTARTKIFKKLLADQRHLTDTHKQLQIDLQFTKGIYLVQSEMLSFCRDSFNLGNIDSFLTMQMRLRSISGG